MSISGDAKTFSLGVMKEESDRVCLSVAFYPSSPSLLLSILKNALLLDDDSVRSRKYNSLRLLVSIGLFSHGPNR